jgi:ketosteroid isomerase-like protein
VGRRVGEDLDVVRRITEPYEGQDIIPAMRASAERLGPDPQPDAMLAVWAEDPLLRHVHPDVEWESPVPGVSTARGPGDLLRWWGEWLEAWRSYTIHILAYRDLGDWVMTVNDIRARGRDDIPLEIVNFQLWQVRDGKVARVRIFFDERAALNAAGPEE